MNFVVCPYDGINLKAVGRPLGPAGSLPVRCPECGRRFELADGEVTEPPDAAAQGLPIAHASDITVTSASVIRDVR